MRGRWDRYSSSESRYVRIEILLFFINETSTDTWDVEEEEEKEKNEPKN